MNTPQKWTQAWIAATAAVGLLGLAGCSNQDQAELEARTDRAEAAVSAQADAAGEKIDQAQADMRQALDDTTITTRVKTAFAESPAVSALAISVETDQGVVSLTGSVATEVERIAAESLARSVADVRDVRNDIVVKS